MIMMSPGVYAQEVDMSTYVAAVSTCMVGMVGAARKGVIGEPVFITSQSEFIEVFGEPILDDYGCFAAMAFLSKGNKLYYVRAAESSAAAAFVDVLQGSVHIEAKESGTYGNDLSIEITSANINTATLSVYNGTSLVEQFTVSTDPASDDFIENISSDYIVIDYNEEASIIPGVVLADEGFVRSGETEWTLTDVLKVAAKNKFSFEMNTPVAPVSFTVKEDSYNILESNSPAGQIYCDGVTVNLNIAEEAAVKVPTAKVSNLKVSVVSLADVPDEESFNAHMPAEYVEKYPFEDVAHSCPVEGNPWLITEFTTSAENARVQYKIYKEDDPEVTLIPEIQLASGPSNAATFKRVGSNFLMFEFLKSRVSCDSLNIYDVVNKEFAPSGTYIFRMEILEDGAVAQILEAPFEVNTEDLKEELATAAAVVSPAPVTIFPKEDIKDGLRSVTYTVAVISGYDKTTSFDVVLSPTGEVFDPYVNEILGDITSTTLQNVAQTSLASGNNGTILNQYTVVSALQVFRNVEELDVNIIAAPGFWQNSVIHELLDIAETRDDCLAVIDPPQGLSAQEVVKWHNGQLEGEDYPKAALNSSYGAVYSPWVQVSNTYAKSSDDNTNRSVWIPPSGPVIAQMAYTDNVAQPWFAPAGLNRGMLTSVLDLENKYDQGKRDLLYGNGNCVNAIVNYKGQGITIFGQRTLQRKSSALDRINVRRLMNLVKKTIVASTLYTLFEQNDGLSWRNWVGTVSPYLETIKTSRGLYDYKVQMDETTVTDAHIDRGEMPGIVWLQPTKTAEFIELKFVLTNTGAVFE